MDIKNLIENLPKAELHLHIEGTLEPEMVFSLAEKNKVNLKFASIEKLKKAYQFNNLQEFLDIYYQGAQVLKTEQDFYDLTWAYLLKAQENKIIHTEIFFDPQTHLERQIDFAIVINGINQALKDGEKKLNISSKLIMCFLRHLSEEDAIKTYHLSKPWHHLIDGIGLDSSEKNNPPEKFKNIYKISEKDNFYLVAHAGEEGDSDYIWQALNLKIKRIDHGVRALEDKSLVNYLTEKQIPLTVCPLSNVCLKVFNKLENHNLKTMLSLGLMVTINSDDPAYFGGYLNDNYYQSAKSLNLNHQQIKQLATNSILAANLDIGRQKNAIKIINDL